MEKNFYSIFKTFFRVGTLLLGGGYVILPLLTSEIVEKKKWITYDELVEYYSVSTSLPGIIAANTAIFVGRKLLGTRGALAAILGMVLPAFVAIILLALVFSEIIQKQVVHNLFWGVGIGVVTLLFLAIREMWTKSVNDKFSAVIYLISFILALSGKVSLVFIIIGVLIFAIVFELIEGKFSSGSDGEGDK